MKEVKFRAWSKKDKVLYEVALIDFIEKMVVDEDAYFWDFDEVELMQYTGLEDKNGVEICARDIVKVKSGMIAEVIFANYQWLLCWIGGYAEFYPFGQECEIIGNAYENPELLEV